MYEVYLMYSIQWLASDYGIYTDLKCLQIANLFDLIFVYCKQIVIVKLRGEFNSRTKLHSRFGKVQN